MKDPMIDEIYGKLKVLATAKRGKQGHLQYICFCSCRNIVTVRKSDLINQHTKSCGCLRKKDASSSTSSYVGVRWNYTENKWEAFYHSWHIGYFIDEEKAAKARDHYVKINVMAKQPMNFRMKA